MSGYPNLKRGLLALLTVTILGGVLTLAVWTGPHTPAAADSAKAEPTWPMFGGTVQRNMVNTTERNVPTAWDVRSGKNIKWVVELGSKAYGGPVVADGKVFIGTNNDRPRDAEVKGDKGVLMCFDEGTGKFLWQSVFNKLASGRVQDWPHEGICSSPFAEGGRIYYVSNRCEVVCSDTNGKKLWTLDMIGTLGVFPHNLATCSPLGVGDTLFLVTSNGVDLDHINVPKPAAPSFIAVSKKDGRVLWQNNTTTAALLKPGAQLKPLADKGVVIMHGQWSNPVYTEIEGKGEVIFPGGNGWIYAFEPATGKEIWKFDCNPKDSFYVLGGKGTRSDFVSTPVVHDGRLYIGVGQDPEHDYGVGHFWCIDVAKATKVGGDVSPVKDNFDPKAGANKNSALAWHYGGMINPAPATGRPYLYGRTMSTACVHKGLCFIGEQEGILHCLDAKTGEEYWQHDMESDCWSSPYYVDGRVFMGNDKNKLLIFEHSKTKKQIAEIDMKAKVRATPTVVNGVLFVMTENKLYAIQKK